MTMNTAGWTISIIAIIVAVVIAIRWEHGSGRARGRGPIEGEGTPDSNLEFMSAPWIAMARREINRALSGHDLDFPTFTLSEEFTDPPAHLAQGADIIGFFVRVGHGRVEVGDRPAPDADCRVISDYGQALSISRDADAGSVDPAEADRRVAEGRLTIQGDPSRIPPVLRQLDLHRLLAAHTA